MKVIKQINFVCDCFLRIWLNEGMYALFMAVIERLVYMHGEEDSRIGTRYI